MDHGLALQGISNDIVKEQPDSETLGRVRLVPLLLDVVHLGSLLIKVAKPSATFQS